MAIYKQCKECQKEYKRRSIFCSKICKYNFTTKEKIHLSRIEYDDNSDKNSYIECKICGYRCKDLGTHTKMHNITNEEYKKIYNVEKLIPVNKILAFSGKNNPWYKHGGKCSPFSEKFTQYQDLNKEDISEKIENLVKTSIDNRISRNNSTTSLSYYTKRGHSIDEANFLLNDRQRTFTLEKCIERHGMSEGITKWEDRQERWQNTLNLKSQEEIDEINKRKSSKVNYRSLWTKSLDEDGSFYFIKLTDELYKFGITSKEKLKHRYKLSDLVDKEILIYITSTINDSFMIEQLVKRKFKNFSISKKDQFENFGWTETLCIPENHEDVIYYVNYLLESNISEIFNETFRKHK